MKNKILLSVILFVIPFVSIVYSKPLPTITGNWSYGQQKKSVSSVPLQQVNLSPNNISSFFLNTGVFDQDKRTTNHPGFEWPKNTGHNACYSAGLSIAAKLEGVLKEASCSYFGEYSPGYVNNATGAPITITNIYFKVYIVKATDTPSVSYDYVNWYRMIPYGAPYDDVNNNGIYDNGIDIPGVKNASSTVFACLTDGYPQNHITTEGFGGGTAPIFSEMHMTAWAYNSSGMEDVQFVKFVVINKNLVSWDSTYIGLVADTDLGYSEDDFVGCDTVRNLGYVYNADNDDSGNQYAYGANPPSFGFDVLKSPINRNVLPYKTLGLTAFTCFSESGVPACETDPNQDITGAYNYLKGLKRDGTPFVDPQTFQTTKKCYPGDPVTLTGWSERKGSVLNCNGNLTGTVLTSNPPGDRKIVMASGDNSFKMQPNDTQTIVVAQMVARQTNNYGSVTGLKQLDDAVQNFYNTNLGVNTVSSSIPSSFSLYQNYPNPFNPSTNIKFNMMRSGSVTLKIYDASGKEVAVLINNEVVPMGTNEVSFDAKSVASGIYFYTLTTGTFTDTKKMVLVK